MQDLKWPLIIIGIGALLVIVEHHMASKKKGGVTVVDKRQMRGIMGVAVVLAVLTWVLIQIS